MGQFLVHAAIVTCILTEKLYYLVRFLQCYCLFSVLPFDLSLCHSVRLLLKDLLFLHIVQIEVLVILHLLLLLPPSFFLYFSLMYRLSLGGSLCLWLFLLWLLFWFLYFYLLINICLLLLTYSSFFSLISTVFVFFSSFWPV